MRDERGKMKEEWENFIEKCLALTKDGSRVLIITKRIQETILEMMSTYSGSREDPIKQTEALRYMKSLNVFFLEDHDTISEVISEFEPEVILSMTIIFPNAGKAGE